MSIRPDPATLVPINSYRGVDGSVSPLRLADGFCQEMENADISTAGVIKKRGGYVTCGGRFPVNGMPVTPGSPTYYSLYRKEYPIGKIPYLTRAYPLSWSGGLQEIVKNIGYIDLPTNFGDYYFFAEFWADAEYPVTENTIFVHGAASESVCRFAPIKIYGNKYAMFSRNVWQAWSGFNLAPAITWAAFLGSPYQDFDTGTYKTIGTQGFVWPMFPIDLIAQIERLSATSAKIYTSLPLPKYTPIRLLGGVDGMITDAIGPRHYPIENCCYVSDTDNRTYFTITEMSGLSAARLDTRPDSTFLFRYALHKKVDSTIDGTPLVDTYILNSDNSIATRTAYLPWGVSTFEYGTGVDIGDVQTVEAFTNLAEGQQNIAALVNGRVFKGPSEYEFLTALRVDQPPAFTTYGTVSAVNGIFTVPYPSASTYYRVGDVVEIKKIDLLGEATSITQLDVAGTTGSELLLSSDGLTSLSYEYGEVWNFTREDTLIPGATIVTNSPYGVVSPYDPVHGDTIFFGGLGSGYSAHELWYTNELVAETQYRLVFKNSVVFSSSELVYVQKRWGEVVFPVEANPMLPSVGSPDFSTITSNGISARPSTSEIVSSVSYSGSSFFSTKDDGVVVFNGTEVYSLRLERPQVETIRSLPGTKGRFPIRVGSNGEKIGKQIEALFVYSYYDSNNRLMESEPSSASEGIFSPNAARDGSDYSELAEYRISPPPTLCGLETSRLTIDVYVRVVDPTTSSDLDYVLYRRVSAIMGSATSIILGDISPEYLSGNKLIYTLSEGKSHLSSPLAKFLVSAAGRLVALNCRSKDYWKLKILKVFNSDNTFGAYTSFHWPCRDRYAGGGAFDPVFYTFPLGVVEVNPGGGLPKTFRPAKDKTEITGYPDSLYPEFTTYSLDYTNLWNGTTGCSVNGDTLATSPRVKLKLTYGDVSDRFNVTTTVTTDQSVKFRFAGSATPTGLPIDFLGDTFKSLTSPPASPTTLRGSTRWTDASLDSTGIPIALRDTTALEFPEAYVSGGSWTDALSKRVLQSQVDNADYGIVISTEAGETKIYYYYDATIAAPVAPAQPNSYCIINGPSTLGNIRKAGTTKILSFDSDLTFITEAVITGTVSVGTRTYKSIRLFPITFTLDATGAYAAQKYEVVADEIMDLGAFSYSMTIYERAALTSPVTFSGFTLPSTTLTVYHTTLRIDTLFAVDDYAIVELSDGDQKRIPQGFPKLMPGAFRVKSVGNTGGGSPYYITIDVPYSPEFRSATTATTSIELDEYSYIVNAKKIIYLTSGNIRVYVGTGAQPYQSLTRSLTVGNAAQAYASFLLLRGADFTSADVGLSGYYWRVGGDSSGYATLRTNLTAIDYSKITGIRYSSFTNVSTSSTYGIPVPCPISLGLADSLLDLALPIFSKTPLLVDVGLVQVGKRITGAINSLYNHFFYAYNDSYPAGLMEAEPNEIIISANTSVLNYITDIYTGYSQYNPFRWTQYDFWYSAAFVSLATDAFYQSTQFVNDGTGTYKTRKVIFGKHHTSSSTSGTSILDNYPNRIQWTDARSETVISPNIPMFGEGNYYDLDTQDDSEILGASSFQNTLIVQKKNSLWRGTFDNYGDLTFQRIQSPVGGYGHNNMPSTLSYMYFINPEGVYYTDGNAVEPVLKLNKLFEDRVNKSQYLLSRTAGFADQKNKQLYVGTPYVSNYITDTADIDGQFNYCYNDGVMGWQVNKGFDAYKWTSINGEYYFASSRGRVYRLRSEPFLSRYRDGEEAVPFAMLTRYLTADEGVNFKFWRNVLFQFGTTSDFTMNVSYQIDFKSTTYPLETYPITGAETVAGAKWYGNDRVMKAIRETFGQRVAQVSFLFTEATIDTDCPIYSVQVQGMLTNTRLVPQKNTRAGGDR